MIENRYIKAMEIGLKNEEKGISYFELFLELTGTKSKVLSKEAEISFFAWFMDNFHNPNKVEKDSTLEINEYRDWLYLYNEEEEYHNLKYINSDLLFLLKERWFLNGHALKQYLDYLELTEARKAAKQAQKSSNISINIAIGAFAVNVVLGFISFTQSLMPKEAQEVKIIEDKTTVKQLEQEIKELQANYQEENKKLREELNKADMMVKLLEGE